METTLFYMYFTATAYFGNFSEFKPHQYYNLKQCFHIKLWPNLANVYKIRAKEHFSI